MAWDPPSSCLTEAAPDWPNTQVKTRLVSASAEEIAAAAALLSQGELVAFATETVYGLGADARQSAAVQKIYAAKGRPSTNPLIVHVLDLERARSLAVEIDARAERLASVFWPGPLTLVLPRRADPKGLAAIAPEVSAGQPTVALRAPSHPVARALLAAFGGPIAAPSANRSLAVSPTTAEHVLEELEGRVGLILDGGATEVGLESTVLDLSGPVPAILRPGMVLRGQIEAALGGPVRVGSEPVVGGVDPPALRSPGQLERHYAPRAPLFIKARAELLRAPGDVALIALGPLEGARVWSLADNAEGYARELYAALRAADQSGAREIWAERPPEAEAWSAIHDRLRRAAHRPG